MADLQITDEFGFSATLQLQDAFPLAKAKIAHLARIDQALKDEIDKPVDQTSLKGLSFGMDCSAPNTTIGNVVQMCSRLLAAAPKEAWTLAGPVVACTTNRTLDDRSAAYRRIWDSGLSRFVVVGAARTAD